MLAVAGTYFRARGLTWGLYDVDVPRRAHPDEWVVYWLFHWFDTRRRLNPCPGPTTQCFFDWGAVYPTVAYDLREIFLAPLSHLAAAFGPQADRRDVADLLAGRFVSLAASALLIPTTWIWGRVIASPWTGAAGAAVVAFAALPVQLAHFATPDSTTVLLAALTLLACTLCVRSEAQWGLVGCGTLLGIATGSEYHMALLALPLVVTWGMTGRRPQILILSALGALVAFIVTNPFVVAEWPKFVAAGIHTLQIRTVQSQSEYQGRFDRYGPDWIYVVRFPLAYGLGVPLTLAVLGGALLSLPRPARTTVLILSWVAPYWVLISVSSAKFMRYGAPLYPALAVLAALGLTRLWAHTSVPLRLASAVLGAAIIIWTSAYLTAYGSLFTGADSRLVAATWMKAHIQRGSQVLFGQAPDGVLNMPYFAQMEGYHPCPLSFNSHLAAESGEYAVWDAYNLEDHPDNSQTQVERFAQALRNPRLFRRVFTIAPHMAILGFRFPLTGSPHDWRYPAHDITIYRSLATPVRRVPCAASD